MVGEGIHHLNLKYGKTSMSREYNKNTVRYFISEILEKGDMSMLRMVCAPNYINRMTGYGVGSLYEFNRVINKAIPDMHFKIESLMAEGDQVVVRYTLTGTYTGVVPGYRPTGKPVLIRGITYYRLENGLIVEHDPAATPDIWEVVGIKLAVTRQL